MQKEAHTIDILFDNDPEIQELEKEIHEKNKELINLKQLKFEKSLSNFYPKKNEVLENFPDAFYFPGNDVPINEIVKDKNDILLIKKEYIPKWEECSLSGWWECEILKSDDNLETKLRYLCNRFGHAEFSDDESLVPVTTIRYPPYLKPVFLNP